MEFKIVASFMILSLLAFLRGSFGRQCYQCYHSTDGTSRNDQNCNEASKKYLRECTTQIALSKDFQKKFIEEKYPVLDINKEKNEEMEFSCIVIDVELYNGKDNLTVRGCAFKHETGFDVKSPSSNTFKTYIYICNTDGCNDPFSGSITLEAICKYFSYTKTVLYAGGAVLGAGSLVAAVPVVIGAAGFTSAGVAAGSLAATAQSGIGSIAGGSIFSILQSVGAGGLAASAKAAIGMVGAAVGGGMFAWFSDILDSKMCN